MSYTETITEYVYDQYCLSYNMEETLDFLEDEIDFTREEIKDMIQYTIGYNKEQFIKYYNSLVEGFKSKFNFTEIDCKKEKIKWPKKSGVYVIWKNDDSSLDNLIYVGMTGKYKRVSKEEVVFNSGTFDKEMKDILHIDFVSRLKMMMISDFRLGMVQKERMEVNNLR